MGVAAALVWVVAVAVAVAVALEEVPVAAVVASVAPAGSKEKGFGITPKPFLLSLPLFP